MSSITGCLVRKAVLGFLLAGAMLLVGSPLWADTFDFSTPTGVLGTSHTYTGSGGGSVTAYGFKCTSGGPATCQTGGVFSGATLSATALFGKADGAPENGLGISGDPLNDNEISQVDFVNINLSNAGATSGTWTFESIQPGESLEYCFGNSNSTWNTNNCGSIVGNGTSTTSIFLSWAGYSDISISGINNDVLVSSLETPVPEPASLTLFGTGLLGMMGVIRRKLKR